MAGIIRCAGRTVNAAGGPAPSFLGQSPAVAHKYHMAFVAMGAIMYHKCFNQA